MEEESLFEFDRNAGPLVISLCGCLLAGNARKSCAEKWDTDLLAGPPGEDTP
jgi:hypothetical protein